MEKNLIIIAIITLIGIFGFTGCDLAGEKTYIGSSADREKMFAAFEKKTEVNSYTETTHVVLLTDGVDSVEQKSVIKYQNKDGDWIAEGYTTMNDEVVSYTYIKENYKYVRLAFAETGIKFSLESKVIDDSMLEYERIISAELEEMAFELMVTITKKNTTIYSFKLIENETKITDYKITTETSSNRLIEEKTDWYNNADLSTTDSCTITYDYTFVIITLPDNLDSYELVE